MQILLFGTLVVEALIAPTINPVQHGVRRPIEITECLTTNHCCYKAFAPLSEPTGRVDGHGYLTITTRSGTVSHFWLNDNIWSLYTSCYDMACNFLHFLCGDIRKELPPNEHRLEGPFLLRCPAGWRVNIYEELFLTEILSQVMPHAHSHFRQNAKYAGYCSEARERHIPEGFSMKPVQTFDDLGLWKLDYSNEELIRAMRNEPILELVATLLRVKARQQADSSRVKCAEIER